MDEAARPSDPTPEDDDGAAPATRLVRGLIRRTSRQPDPRRLAEEIVQAIQADGPSWSFVGLLARKAGQRSLRLLASAGKTDGAGSRRGAIPSTVIEAVRRGRAVRHDETARPVGFLSQESRASLSIPIQPEGEALHVLHLESRDGAAFKGVERGCWEILGEHLAGVLADAMTTGPQPVARIDLRRLSGICERILTAPSPGEAADRAARALVEELEYDAACLLLAGPGGGPMSLQAVKVRGELKPGRDLATRIAQGALGRAALEGRSLCRDVAADPEDPSCLAGAGSELCVPLQAEGEPLGLLAVFARASGTLGAEDVALAQMLARPIALAAHHARSLARARQTLGFLENLVETAGDGILAVDPLGRMTRWNQGMERLTGYQAGEVLGRTLRELEAMASLSRVESNLARVMGGEILQGVEERARCKDGRLIDVVLTLSPIRGPAGQVEGASMIVRDVTERRRMETELWGMHRQILEAEEELLGMLEKADDAIFFVDSSDGRILQANLRAEQLTGRPRAELIGTCFTELHPEPDGPGARQQFEKAVVSGSGGRAELRLRTGTTEPLEVEVVPALLHYAGRTVVQWLCRDISDRRRAEREKETLQVQLLQTEKLSAIGQLISGVAHELNNPLTGVIGYAQLLMGQDCEERIRRGLEKVHAEAKRCHRIVQNLLTFARKHTPEKRFISINDIIESTIELRAYQLRVDDIQVVSELSRDLPGTMGDSHQLQQVLMNIVTNAQQAMKDSSGKGTLRIVTELVEDRIRIRIRDDGPGIPEENLKKVFDPFFTTKQTGQGTGLGLSICYGIIKEHQGRIWAASEVGKGTTFTIELPVLARDSEAPAASVPPARAAEAPGAEAGAAS